MSCLSSFIFWGYVDHPKGKFTLPLTPALAMHKYGGYKAPRVYQDSVCNRHCEHLCERGIGVIIDVPGRGNDPTQPVLQQLVSESIAPSETESTEGVLMLKN